MPEVLATALLVCVLVSFLVAIGNTTVDEAIKLAGTVLAMLAGLIITRKILGVPGSIACNVFQLLAIAFIGGFVGTVLGFGLAKIRATRSS